MVTLSHLSLCYEQSGWMAFHWSFWSLVAREDTSVKSLSHWIKRKTFNKMFQKSRYQKHWAKTAFFPVRSDRMLSLLSRLEIQMLLRQNNLLLIFPQVRFAYKSYDPVVNGEHSDWGILSFTDLQPENVKHDRWLGVDNFTVLHHQHNTWLSPLPAAAEGKTTHLALPSLRACWKADKIQTEAFINK